MSSAVCALLRLDVCDALAPDVWKDHLCFCCTRKRLVALVATRLNQPSVHVVIRGGSCSLREAALSRRLKKKKKKREKEIHAWIGEKRIHADL